LIHFHSKTACEGRSFCFFKGNHHA
jgi:hypothetical protein